MSDKTACEEQSRVDLEDDRDMRWLLARARGEEVPPPDPERAASYARLEGALKALPLANAPNGWQRRVLAAIASQSGPVPSHLVVGPGIRVVMPALTGGPHQAIRDAVYKAYGGNRTPGWPDPTKGILGVTCDGKPYEIGRKMDGFTVRAVEPNEVEP